MNLLISSSALRGDQYCRFCIITWSYESIRRVCTCERNCPGWASRARVFLSPFLMNCLVAHLWEAYTQQLLNTADFAPLLTWLRGRERESQVCTVNAELSRSSLFLSPSFLMNCLTLGYKNNAEIVIYHRLHLIPIIYWEEKTTCWYQFQVYGLIK